MTTASRPGRKRPATSAEHQVFLAIQRAASALSAPVADLLREAGLSAAQYNVLRILRGAPEEGLACGEVADRLVTRDPDMTRLLDRLEKSGLIVRSREKADRRVVTTRITGEGLRLLAQLDEPVADLHRRQLSHLGKARLAQLASLLDEATRTEVAQ